MESENKVRIRRLINGDKDEIIEIENRVFEFSWSRGDLNKELSQKNCFGMVAEQMVAEDMVAEDMVAEDMVAEDKVAEHNGKRIVGYFICELIDNMIHVLNFAVHEGFQGQGIGKQMVDELIRELAVSRRSRICCQIRETNLMALVFFHKRGFRVVKILKNPWKECSDDLIRMVYRNNGSKGMNRSDRVQRLHKADQRISGPEQKWLGSVMFHSDKKSRSANDPRYSKILGQEQNSIHWILAALMRRSRLG